MTKKIYSKKQIKELLNNPYVEKCSERYITYKIECKNEFLKLLKQGLFYREIFQILWFPLYIVNSKIPERAYNRWKKYLENWVFELKNKAHKKERLNFESMTIEEQNEYLKAENAYLKEFNKSIYGHYP